MARIIGWTTENGHKHPVFAREGNQRIRKSKSSLETVHRNGKTFERRVTESEAGGKSRRLSYEERRKLPSEAFAVPGRKYPVPTEKELENIGYSQKDAKISGERHARNALARVSQHGTASEKRDVCKTVSKRYPEVHASSCKMH